MSHSKVERISDSFTANRVSATQSEQERALRYERNVKATWYLANPDGRNAPDLALILGLDGEWMPQHWRDGLRRLGGER